MHLDRCKRLRQPDVRQKLLAGITSKANAMPELGNYTFDQDFARRKLGNMIILHEYPLSIVDHVMFRRYSSALQPLFKIPTRNTVKNDIINIYEHEKEQVMKLLEGIRSRVAITIDLWTSGNQKKGFMAVTGHFIDEEFILQSRILSWRPGEKGFAVTLSNERILSDGPLSSLLLGSSVGSMGLSQANAYEGTLRTLLHLGKIGMLSMISGKTCLDVKSCVAAYETAAVWENLPKLRTGRCARVLKFLDEVIYLASKSQENPMR
ncbi:hypothetical protein RJ639_038380 [Escallonia herrerae]|uniref:Uncharacterized protein n=1 Tax=Escallonia herrerae TaxID=1293975 RepID=A0AA89B5I1_9ASTE|nr:hypothetical protein RJ639_038380 [Escallonia herrerae]